MGEVDERGGTLCKYTYRVHTDGCIDATCEAEVRRWVSTD